MLYTCVLAGPRLCFSCPIDCDQFQTWFTRLWNYSIVPYVVEAVRQGVQVGCVGPTRCTAVRGVKGIRRTLYHTYNMNKTFTNKNRNEA